MSSTQHIPSVVLDRFRAGTVIPAVPLALNAQREFDAAHQRALLRYYIDAGAGGLAVGVHTTQFAIRDPKVGLFEPVLTFASEAIDSWCAHRGHQIIKIAGICGRREQALQEAGFAREVGYHAGLVSLGAYDGADAIEPLVDHCRAVAEILPVIGFYLQPAVGGRILPYAFWRAFAELDGVIGIKIAPFNRYQTLDVVRAVCDAGRAREVVLYTGNDDNIVGDLVTPFVVERADGPQVVRIVGGLLGQWAVWTSGAVDLLSGIQQMFIEAADISPWLLTQGVRITDANSALFDVANGFAGCIPGIHEVLRRQGLLDGIWCLDPDEGLSPGQLEEIDRVYNAYPELNDDAFVAEHLSQWLS